MSETHYCPHSQRLRYLCQHLQYILSVVIISIDFKTLSEHILSFLIEKYKNRLYYSFRRPSELNDGTRGVGPREKTPAKTMFRSSYYDKAKETYNALTLADVPETWRGEQYEAAFPQTCW